MVRVLVVDDEASLLMTLVANLELEGFDVEGCERPDEALQRIAREPFDVVLSDIRMPGMTGVELFRRVREVRPELPFVLMTGFALEDLVQEAVQGGAFAVLPKPCTMEHVLRVISRALRAPAVLVVDDARASAESLAEALSASGIRAKAALSASEAMGIVRDGAVDVCVVDMVMPELDGPATMARLRDLDPSVAFIAISGENASDLLRRAAAMGAFACMRKPLSTRALAHAIAQARALPTHAR
jgi:DNA-binding NtrC family response regulator